jgi:5-(carboxyamino)imidazole ribonucleotide mutase
MVRPSRTENYVDPAKSREAEGMGKRKLRVRQSQGRISAKGLSGQPIVGVLGGSKSDFHILEKAGGILTQLGIPYELLVVSAHRTPDRLFEYATTASERGIQVIIGGAGGAAHLPGMLAAKTHLPVIGVPIPTENLRGLDSLLSIVQMPRGIPVATVAIGGAENAGLLAAQILSGSHPEIAERLIAYRRIQTETILHSPEAKGVGRDGAKMSSAKRPR